MPEVISKSNPKARKQYECMLCGGTINKGEIYDRQVCKYDGEIYSFISHKQCNEISSMLWNYIDPDEGMTSEDFQEGIGYYCYQFICPHCDNWNSEDSECQVDYDPMESRLYLVAERLKKYPLKRVKTKYGTDWKEE